MRSLTTEEIMEACPEVIRAKDLPVKNPGGHPPFGGGSRQVSWYNEKIRIKAASLYAVHANFVKVEEICGVPVHTLRRWRGEDWWGQVTDRVKIEKDDEHDKKLTEIMDKAIEALVDRLEKGDTVLTKKGDKVIKPMGGKEIGVVLSIAADKRDQIRRKAKTTVEAASTKELLTQIAGAVRAFLPKQPKIIEGEVIHVEENLEQVQPEEPGREALPEVVDTETIEYQSSGV